jgi:hypothetical protein
MIGGGFQHADSSCGWEIPKYVEWNKGNRSADVSIHIDGTIFTEPVDPSKLNIGWFCESPYYLRFILPNLDNPGIKQRIVNDFDYIFTNDKTIISKHPEFKYLLPHAFTWCKDRAVFPKTKNWSIIASEKKDAPGHHLRHEVVQAYGPFIEVFGRGYKKIDSKNEGLNDFRYSFAIENIITEGYWTEKVVDCFATGTIPIYWGANSVNEYFLEEGILRLNDEFDLSLFATDYYNERIDIVRENFERAINLPLPEDYIFLHYLK